MILTYIIHYSRYWKPLDQSHSVCEVWHKLDYGDREYALGKAFFKYHTVVTLTFNPEIWFKVTENPLPKGKLCVKFKLCWAREKEGVHWTRYLRQTEGRTDWSPQVARRVETLKVKVNSVKNNPTMWSLP